MNVLWVVQEINHDQDTSQRIMFAAQELGHEAKTLRYGGVRSVEWPDELPKGCERPVVFLGSLTAIKDHQRRHGGHGYPFAWCDWNKLSCRYYYSKLGDFLLGRRYGMYPYAEVVRCHEQLWRDFAVDGRVFIRPDSNDKVFDGQVVHLKNFDAWKGSVEAWEKPADDLLCVVASPTAVIKAEDRVVVVDGVAVTASQYKCDGKIDVVPRSGYREGSLRFAEEVAKCWSPHRAFVCDVALTGDGEFRLVEIGSVNAAGYYGCDVREIARGLSEAAQKDWDEGYGEAVA